MAEGSPQGGGSFPLNPNSLLALLTLAAGAWLVSHKLTSERPVTPAGGTRQFVGEQELEARLWEDPLKNSPNDLNDPWWPGSATFAPGDIKDISLFATKLTQKSDALSAFLSSNLSSTTLQFLTNNQGPASNTVTLQAGLIADINKIIKEQNLYSTQKVAGIDITRPETEELGKQNAQGEALARLNRLVLEDAYPQELSRNYTNALVQQILERSEENNRVLLLPVMLSGGHYSEDQESRIRSRFAIVSALGISGYAPEDAEHIGEQIIGWPTAHELDENIKKSSQAKITNIWQLCTPLSGMTNAKMELRYEWYRPREFYPHQNSELCRTNILVLWLDDSFFEDEPLLRLPVLLAPLTHPNGVRGPDGPVVRLIGPRRSATLRAMLPRSFGGSKPSLNEDLRLAISNFLGSVSVYCATPSAMDEVLVKEPNPVPRNSVGRELINAGFNYFQNFAATDKQLAKEVLDELALRGAALTNQANHLVLISESDTFYARVLSLTYQAALDHPQSLTSTLPWDRYVQDFKEGKKKTPKNFHSFVYLRGLDGQTVGGDSSAKSAKPDNERSAKAYPTSVEELRKWVPDANKAEGQAQFDYLSRLGDRLAELERTLYPGHIRAVGIVGSDVYDTLLILQALRDEFPDVLFFTTDLDARYCHPRESRWARNLIVVSGYGLTLHANLQGDVAPFRDSTQTAQFAAALAALGNTNFTSLTSISPRRFEIGNRTAVDLSTTNTLLSSPKNWLHPLTASETYASVTNKESWFHPVALCGSVFGARDQFDRRTPSLCALALAIGLASWFWRPLRNRTFGAFSFLAETLNYHRCDVGGVEGGAALVSTICSNPDPLCEWFAKKLKRDYPSHFPPHGFEIIANGHKQQQAEELTCFLNRVLRREVLVDEAAALKSFLATERITPKAQLRKGPASRWNPVGGLRQIRNTRLFLDKLLDGLTERCSEPRNSQLTAADSARRSADKLFGFGFWGILGIWISSAAIVTVVLNWILPAIWQDTFGRPDGEPFSLVSGISAWPAIVLRLATLLMTIAFIVTLLSQLRIMYYRLTRRYRFLLEPQADTPPSARVCASELWFLYCQKGAWWLRMLRAGAGCFFYYFLVRMFFLLFSPIAFQPLRGDTTRIWSQSLRYPLIISFFLLTFLTIDAALLCCWFIRELSAKPTNYPEASRAHFRRRRGNVSNEYLDHWIDVQLIADLTEGVGRLLWFPAIVFLLMLLARNEWWDHWPWHAPLITVMTLNFFIAVASLVILQRAATVAKAKAEEDLAAKIKRLQAEIAPSAAQNDATQAERLLEEIQNLRRGAFVPFWESPVLGAAMVGPSGFAVLQMLLWFLAR